MADIFGRIRDQYSSELASPTRLCNLREEMFIIQDDFAMLKAKAAETAHLLPVLLEVCKETDDGSRRDAHRIIALETLAEVGNNWRDSGMFLDRPTWARALRALEKHMLHYDWLCRNSLTNGYLCYPIRFKTHHLWHIVDHAKYMNPRALWCHAFEDFMGACVRSAKASVAGTKTVYVGSKVMEHFRIVLEMRLRRGRLP